MSVRRKLSFVSVLKLIVQMNILLLTQPNSQRTTSLPQTFEMFIKALQLYTTKATKDKEDDSLVKKFVLPFNDIRLCKGCGARSSTHSGRFVVDVRARRRDGDKLQEWLDNAIQSLSERREGDRSQTTDICRCAAADSVYTNHTELQQVPPPSYSFGC